MTIILIPDYDIYRSREDFIVNNPINNYKINNSSNNAQYKNTFLFIRTAIDWNQLDDSEVKAKSTDSFINLVHRKLNMD